MRNYHDDMSRFDQVYVRRIFAIDFKEKIGVFQLVMAVQARHICFVAFTVFDILLGVRKKFFNYFFERVFR